MCILDYVLLYYFSSLYCKYSRGRRTGGTEGEPDIAAIYCEKSDFTSNLNMHCL